MFFEGDKNSTHKTRGQTIYLFPGHSPHHLPPSPSSSSPLPFCPLSTYLLSPPPPPLLVRRLVKSSEWPDVNARGTPALPSQGPPPFVPCMVCGLCARDERMKVNSALANWSFTAAVPFSFSRSLSRSAGRSPRRISRTTAQRVVVVNPPASHGNALFLAKVVQGPPDLVQDSRGAAHLRACVESVPAALAGGGSHSRRRHRRRTRAATTPPHAAPARLVGGRGGEFWMKYSNEGAVMGSVDDAFAPRG